MDVLKRNIVPVIFRAIIYTNLEYAVGALVYTGIMRNEVLLSFLTYMLKAGYIAFFWNMVKTGKGDVKDMASVYTVKYLAKIITVSFLTAVIGRLTGSIVIDRIFAAADGSMVGYIGIMSALSSPKYLLATLLCNILLDLVFLPTVIYSIANPSRTVGAALGGGAKFVLQRFLPLTACIAAAHLLTISIGRVVWPDGLVGILIELFAGLIIPVVYYTGVCRIFYIYEQGTGNR